MPLDLLSLVLHVVAAAVLVGAGITQVLAGGRLRSATSAENVAQWATFARSAGPVLIAAAVVSLATGGHLAGAVWGGNAGGFSNPFITIGAAGLVLLAPVGPMLGGARLRRLAQRAGAPDADPASLSDEARSATIWGPVHSLVGVGVGLIWIMVAKPGWPLAIVIVLGTFALGWGSGVLVSSRPGAPLGRAGNPARDSA